MFAQQVRLIAVDEKTNMDSVKQAAVAMGQSQGALSDELELSIAEN